MEFLAQARAAVLARPGDDEALAALGNELTELGRLDQAATVLRRAIEAAPGRAGHVAKLAKAMRFRDGDPSLPAIEALARRAASLPEPERIELGFALGKIYADLGRDEAAWQAYAEANALARGEIVYDEQAALDLIRRIGEVFTADLLASA
jgi:tetratricopeptide (TPR) repeat protein